MENLTLIENFGLAFYGIEQCLLIQKRVPHVEHGETERWAVRDMQDFYEIAMAQRALAKLKGDAFYLKLQADLRGAKSAAAAAAGTEDGGTCNFDSLAIDLTRKNEARVLAAIEQAGLHGHKASGRMWRGSYLVSPPACGQGNSRTRAAEAMKKVMAALGWDVTVYYQMD